MRTTAGLYDEAKIPRLESTSYKVVLTLANQVTTRPWRVSGGLTFGVDLRCEAANKSKAIVGIETPFERCRLAHKAPCPLPESGRGVKGRHCSGVRSVSSVQFNPSAWVGG